mgnify:CR=1 FL=1|tara:strand:- start:67 stop:258 length:192 start_codon:yes stop_codon:yes gene_type:complete
MQQVKIENVKKGEFVRRKLDAKTTFIKDEYCRFDKRYILMNDQDISRSIGLKKGTTVFIGFTY